MFGGDDPAGFQGGRQQRPFGQVVGPPQQAAGALVDGGDGFLGKQTVRCAGHLEMVGQVGGHVRPPQGLQAAFAQHPGGEGPGGVGHRAGAPAACSNLELQAQSAKPIFYSLPMSARANSLWCKVDGPV